MKYSDEQLSFLSENRTLQRKELTELFNQTFNTNKSVKAINTLCKRYNFLTGRTGRFIPDQNPWNKGIKNSTGHHPNTRKTQFKKGNVPHGHKPIGSERVDKDGYTYRKISDNRNPARKDWKMVHVLLWEEHHGEVPQNHAVAFKDGNNKNIVIENLELISRKELMRRNTIHRYPPELKQVIRLTGKLRRTIDEKSK